MLIKDTCKNVALYVAITALFAALLTGGKMALAAFPNVEVVTILIAVFAYVWGAKYSLPAVVAFIVLQILFYGFNIWVIQYFLHWPAVALVYCLMGKVNWKRKWVVVALSTTIAVVITVLFGVMTSATDTFVSYTSQAGFKFVLDDYWARFGLTYIRGISFYVTQVICNAVLFVSTFLPLVNALKRAKLGLGL